MLFWATALASSRYESSIKYLRVMFLAPTILARFVLRLLLGVAAIPALGQQAPGNLTPNLTSNLASNQQRRAIWADPGDIKSKDLFNGPGGEKHRPQLPVKFLKEDKHGHNSKLDVEDSNGKKWKAKLGIEAQPETVATRLLWAVGYFTNEDYFIPDPKIEGLPAHLHRGQ